VVTQVRPVDAFYHLREDMRSYTHACYVAELLDVLTDEGDPDPPIFELLLAALEALDAGGDATTLARCFELKLLSRLGYGPELDVCVTCGAKAGDGEAGFSVSQGGVTCGECLRAAGAAPISPVALRALRDLRRLPPEELAERRLSAAPREEVGRLMRSFVDHLLGRPLRSTEFLTL
jgi:DNA repair protein RecO (recombination protein O)